MSNWQVVVGETRLVYLMPPCRQLRKKDSISKEDINPTEPCILQLIYRLWETDLCPCLCLASAPRLIWFYLVQTRSHLVTVAKAP